MIRVYVLGEARGTYRIQNFVKMLMDNRKKYKVCYNTLCYDHFILRYLKSFFIHPFTLLRANVVYVCTLNVDLNILYELLIARLFRKKIVVDFYVSVYDTVVLDRKWFQEHSLLAKCALLCDKLFLRLADKVLFLTLAESKRYTELAGIDLDSLSWDVVPLGVEEKPQVRSAFINGNRNELHICWWGTYVPLHGLEIILKTAKIVKEKNSSVFWHFMGNDEEKSKPYVKMIQEWGLDGVCEIHNNLTFNNGGLQDFLNQNCDVALGVFGAGNKSVNVIANKLIDACAMKSIVLTGESPAVREFFDDDCIFYSKRQPEEIAEAVLQIFNMPREQLKERVEKTYDVYQKNFSIPVFRSNMEHVLYYLKTGK